MTKQELYKATIDCFKQTGQGLPGNLLRYSGMGQVVDELIKEGLVKSINTGFKTLPDEEWIFPTKGYCYAEDELNWVRNLTFVRVYLKLDDLGLGMRLKDVMSDPDFAKEYNDWRITNIDKLLEIETLEVEEVKPSTAIVLEKEEVDLLKSFACYENNETVKEILALTVEMANCHKRLIEVCSKRSDYADKKEESEIELKKLKSIIAFLTLSDFEKPIKELIK